MAESDVDLARLCQAMYRARQVLRVPRANRTEMVRQYVGKHWSDEGTGERVPVNLLSLYCSIVGRSLIAKNPRVMLSSFVREAKPVVSAMQEWANDQIEEMDLANTMQRIVLDALFSVGIGKVALATPADAARAGWLLGAGRPFAERVDLDDFVYDVHARDFAEVTFIGHRFRAPLDAIKDGKFYSKGRLKLEPDTDQPYNLEGDERISVLGRTFLAGDVEEFEEHVTLWEVYLPRRRVVVTLQDDWLTGPTSRRDRFKPLRQQDWLGPDCGPYHLLGYEWVPGNAMPKGPLQDVYDLHEAVNRLYRKLIRQAERQKDLTGYARMVGEDAERVQNASDGEMVGLDNPDKINPISMGGANQNNFVMADHLVQKFSYMAGNLDAAGGLAPQAKTLGQDQLLQQNATGTIADKQERTIKYTAGMLRALCWYWYHDPQREMKSRWKVPGLPDYQVTRKVTPADRQQHAFEDLQIAVDPYSMQQATPATRAQAIIEVVNLIAPMMQLAQQQGIALDMNALLNMLGKYRDLPELADILTTQEPPQEDGDTGGGESEGPGMPQNTTRTYNRVSQGNRSQDNKHQELMQSLQAAQGPQKNGMVNRG